MVIDDDPNSLSVIEEHIMLVPKLNLLKCYLDPVEAIDDFGKIEKLDFLFLDINMRLSGLELAKLLRDKVRFIIFVTGHPEHALAAFQVHADRFLQKPLGFPKLLMTINQLLHHHINFRR